MKYEIEKMMRFINNDKKGKCPYIKHVQFHDITA